MTALGISDATSLPYIFVKAFHASDEHVYTLLVAAGKPLKDELLPLSDMMTIVRFNRAIYSTTYGGRASQSLGRRAAANATY